MRVIFVKILLTVVLFAGDSTLNKQFKYALELYEKGNIYDSYTEFERLKYFDHTGNFIFSANYYQGFCLREAGMYELSNQKFLEAIQNAKDPNQVFDTNIMIIKNLILSGEILAVERRIEYAKNSYTSTTQNEQLDFWKGWALMFEGKWTEASKSFTGIDEYLTSFCDSMANESLNVTTGLILSVIPGLGQVYAGKYLEGAVSFAWNIFSGYLTVNSFINKDFAGTVLAGNFLFLRFITGNFNNTIKYIEEKNFESRKEAINQLLKNYKGQKP